MLWGMTEMIEQHTVAQHQVCGPSPRKISSFLQSVKDDLEPKTPGVYSIPWECCRVYIGQTNINAAESFMASLGFLLEGGNKSV